ncbi:MAG: hypothetical protein LBL87_07365 [Ruminococcus sp.]|jgi:hypothetical protein|nr:hypothetical protein [Ruminococcus sp.]
MAYTEHSGLVIEESLDGFGLSGVLSTEMRVTLYTSYFNAPENAEVTVEYQPTGGLVTFPKFYIVSRDIKGSRVDLICRCKMQKLDRPFPISGLIFDSAGEISTVYAVQRIAEQIECSTSFPLSTVIPKLSQSFLKNNNCLLILEKLSEALAGFWRIWNGTLTFVPFENAFMSLVTVAEHGKINTGMPKIISRVVMSGGGETFEYGAGSFSQTICLETEFATAALAASVYSRLSGYTYYPVMKTMCRSYTFPGATADVTFAGSDNIYGKNFRINSIKAYPRRSGLYLEMSNNGVREDEWDYSGKVGREIKRLNQLFSALEEGGDTPSGPAWESDPDWEDFNNMPRESGRPLNVDVMVKVISASRTVVLTVQTWSYAIRVDVDWGDNTENSDYTLLNEKIDSHNTYYNYKGTLRLTHTFPRTGTFYVRIKSQSSGAVMLAPRDGMKNNPPLVIGWKLNYGMMMLLLNGNVKQMWSHMSDYELPYGDTEFFYRTKFIDVLGQSDMESSFQGKRAMLYNPLMIEWVKKNYVGIDSEDDLAV